MIRIESQTHYARVSEGAVDIVVTIWERGDPTRYKRDKMLAREIFEVPLHRVLDEVHAMVWALSTAEGEGP